MGVGTYSRLGALKVLFQGGVVGLGAYSRLGAYYIFLPSGWALNRINTVADVFEWLLKNNYGIQDLMHYLDDYFTVGPTHSSVCAHNVKTILYMASQVGIPIAPNKLEGPTTRLVFLGILINTNSMKTSLPDDKLHKLISELQS